MSDTSPAQRTAPARAALAAKFSSPEQKSQYFRDLSARSHAGRLQLSGEDAAALTAAYRLLHQISVKYRLSEREIPPMVLVGGSDA